MLRNQLISIFRNLKKNKGYTAINISGLAIGFAAATLIAIYVYQEFTFDRHHKDYDRIYRVSARSFAFSSIAHMNHLASNMAGVEAWTTVAANSSSTLKHEQQSWVEKDVYYGTEDYFKVFEQDFISGSAATAFDPPNAMVITESMSSKMFRDQDPIGQTVTLSTQNGNGNYVITGVVKDHPVNSHLKFQVLARRSQEYVSSMLNNFNMTTDYCYFKLGAKRDIENLQAQADDIFTDQAYNSYGQDESYEEFSERFKKSTPWILGISDVHLESDLRFESSASGNKQYLMIFLGIAVFIIALAAINYINLATSQASKRAKEVGIRKVLGSVRGSMIRQFLAESLLLTIMAVVIGLGLAEAALQLMSSLGFSNFEVSVYNYPGLIGFILVIGLITGLAAGVYPSFYLTSFTPSSVLKGDYKVSDKSKLFRSSLVVFQFVVSFSLAIFSVFVYQQLQYGLNKDLGFDKENVVVIDNSKSQLSGQVQTFRNELLSQPLISGVSASHYSLIDQLAMISVTGKGAEDDLFQRANYKYVDEHFTSTMGFRIVEGRDFNPEIEGDSAAIMVNQAFAKALGGENIIGRRFDANFNGRDVVVVGIVEDFHYKNMSETIAPTIFFNRGDQVFPSQINVKLSGNNIKESLAAIEGAWTALSDEPLEYYFFDQSFNQLFESDQRMSKIISIFTSLSLFVALLGLIGLISYKLDQRIREIGIRKVLGASIKQILGLFSLELTKLILIAIVITVPLGFYVTTEWLNGFAYHIEIGVAPFVITAILGLGITVAIVCLRTIKTASMNPVNALRSE